MSRFYHILENFINYGNNDGFSIRDIVKFVKDYKSKDFYKHAVDDIKNRIDDMASSDKLIRVINIKTSEPIPGNSVTNDNSRGKGRLIEIAVEYAPHRTDNSKSISVCPCMLEIIKSDGINLPHQPSIFDKKYDEYFAKFNGVDKKYFRRQSEVHGKLQDMNLDLPTKNITISNSSNGKVSTNIVSDSVQYQENPLMESYLEELSN